MPRKEKIIVSLSLIIILSYIFVFVMIAGAFNPGHSFHKQGMPHFVKKEISEFVLWKLDKSAGELNLGSAQQEEYDTFRTALEQTISKGMDTKLEMKKMVMTEFNKEIPDLAAVTTGLQSHIEQMSSRITENLAQFTTLYNSLDPDQKKQITDHIKEKRQACKNTPPGLH